MSAQSNVVDNQRQKPPSEVHNLIHQLDQQLSEYSLEEQRAIDQQIQLYRHQKQQQKRQLNQKVEDKHVVDQKSNSRQGEESCRKKKVSFASIGDDVSQQKKSKKISEKQKAELLEKRRQEAILSKRRELQRRKEKILANKKQVLDIVEQLISPEIEQNEFLEQVAILCKSDYEDVIVERSITGICGYVLCMKRLDERSRRPQQFKIVLQSHQVFDITERKMFCSDLCFASSEHIKSQLFDQPLWIREDEQSAGVAQGLLQPNQNQPTTAKKMKKTIELYKGKKGQYGMEVKLGVSLVQEMAHEVHDLGSKCKVYCIKCNRRKENGEQVSNCQEDKCENGPATKSNRIAKKFSPKQIKPGNFPYIRPEELTKLQGSMQRMQIKEKLIPVKDTVVEKMQQISLDTSS